MGKNMGKKDSKKYQKKYQRRNKVNHKAKIGIGCMVAVLVIILSVQSVRLYDKNAFPYMIPIVSRFLLRVHF